METIQELNEQLSKGILPDSLYFGKREAQTTDWAKIQYNTFYKNPSYFSSKFPPEWVDTFPCFDKLVGIFADKAKTPLEEMEERQQLINTVPN